MNSLKVMMLAALLAATTQASTVRSDAYRSSPRALEPVGGSGICANAMCVNEQGTGEWLCGTGGFYGHKGVLNASTYVAWTNGPQDVSDFYKSKPGDAHDPAVKVTSEKNDAVGRNVISAIDASGRLDETNTVRAANDILQASKTSGCEIIATPHGLGVVAYGCSTYAKEGNNPNLVAEAHRFACVEAHLYAQQQLASFLNGLTTEGKVAMATNSTVVDAADRSLVNTEKRATESYKETISALIRGAVAFDIDDDADNGRVAISVYASPRTIGQVQTTSMGTLTAKSIEDGLAFVLKEIEMGIVPPVGGRFIVVPTTGQFYWVAFGAEYAKHHKNPDNENILRDVAVKGAAMKANNALLAILKGVAVEGTSVFDKNYERISSEFDETTGVAKQAEEVAAVCRTRTRTEVSSVAEGKLPPGVMPRNYSKGRWMYTIAMYNPEISAAAAELANNMKQHSPLHVRPMAVEGGFKTEPNGGFKKGPDGNLIPESFGRGRITKDL